jgi:pimeloyl-ACP methyl ester carboxylesterase
MPFLTTKDGCNLFYTAHGIDTSKPVVIFLNGTTQTTLYWGAHVPVLSKRLRLLFYDARAQGQSDLGDKPISLELHVNDLKFLMTQLGIDKAHLVGISHGARVALAMAVECPEMVDRMVLCSLGAKTDQRGKVTVRSWLQLLHLSGLEAMAWAALPTVFGEKFLKQHQNSLDMIVNAVVKRNTKRALIAQLDAILQYPPPDGMPAVFDRPTLIITGAEDPLVNSEDVERLADLCDARHEKLAGIGHSIPAEAPRVFEKRVLEFLTEKVSPNERNYSDQYNRQR